MFHTLFCTLVLILSHTLSQGVEKPWRVAAHQEGTGSVRFDSVPELSNIHRFSSVRFGKSIFPVRRGSACVFRTRSGPVRFGSVPRPVPAGSRITRFGSVRPVRFGVLLPPAIHILTYAIHTNTLIDLYICTLRHYVTLYYDILHYYCYYYYYDYYYV